MEHVCLQAKKISKLLRDFGAVCKEIHVRNNHPLSNVLVGAAVGSSIPLLTRKNIDENVVETCIRFVRPDDMISVTLSVDKNSDPAGDEEGE